jgi:hypothetical protein
MTQSNLTTMIGFTLFGALMGSFLASAGFVMWIVSETAGLVVGSVFFAISALVLARRLALSPVLGLGGGLFLGALIGALVGLAFNNARLALEIPLGVGGALAGGALSLIAWGIVGLAFGEADPKTKFQPRFSFAIAMLFAWIVGFGSAFFYPALAGWLNGLMVGTGVGGIAGMFVGSAMAMEAQRRESQRPKKR